MTRRIILFLSLCIITIQTTEVSCVSSKSIEQTPINLSEVNTILKDAQSTYDKTLSLSEKNIDFANTLIQWAALILAFTGIIIAIGAYLGFREFGQIKKAVAEVVSIKNDSQKQLEEIVKIKEETIQSLQEIKKEFISKSETFMISSFNYNIGQQAYNASDFERAVEYFINAYKYNPNDVHILCRIGRSLCNLDRNYQANEYFEKALLIEENSHEALSGLATSMRYIDLGKAIEYCKKALLINPNDAFLYDYLGLLYRDKDLINLSFDCHNEAIRIDPASSVSYFYLSLIQAKLGKLNESHITILESINRIEGDKKIRPVWKQSIKICLLILENKLDRALKECIKQKELISNNNRVKKVILSHLIFLLDTLHLDNTAFIKILENE